MGKRKELQSHGRRRVEGVKRMWRGNTETISSTRSQTGTQPRVVPSRFDSIACPRVATWVSRPEPGVQTLAAHLLG